MVRLGRAKCLFSCWTEWDVFISSWGISEFLRREWFSVCRSVFYKKGFKKYRFSARLGVWTRRQLRRGMWHNARICLQICSLEQRVLNMVLYPRYKNGIHIYSYRDFGSKDSPMIRHIWSAFRQNRSRLMDKNLAALGFWALCRYYQSRANTAAGCLVLI